jgi:hypothetical protein
MAGYLKIANQLRFHRQAIYVSSFIVSVTVLFITEVWLEVKFYAASAK